MRSRSDFIDDQRTIGGQKQFQTQDSHDFKMVEYSLSHLDSLRRQFRSHFRRIRNSDIQNVVGVVVKKRFKESRRAVRKSPADDGQFKVEVDALFKNRLRQTG